jgi:8-oxo-dGTP pyrophosphatase MutT (NUDIX family)
MTSEATSVTSDQIYVVIVALRGSGPTEFLMVHNKNRGWELPGGKLEGKEGPVHCALREFREETGHLLGEPKYVMKLQRDNGVCHVFKGMMGPKVEERDDDAIDADKWFTTLPDELAFPDDPYDQIGAKLHLSFR